MSQPEPMFMGVTRLELDELDSTNRYARDLLESRPPEGTLILAHTQTAGRGLAENTWYAEPRASLSFSLILYPGHIPPNRLFGLSILTANSLADSLQALYPGYPVQIKWPNDLLLNEKKIAGILIENTWQASRLSACIVGVGLNLNTRHFPEALQAKASSLLLETGKEISAEAFFGQFLSRLEGSYLQSRGSGYDFRKQDYLFRLWRYQEWATYYWEGQQQEGMIIGVSPEGKLAVQTRENSVKYFDLKEIVYG